MNNLRIGGDRAALLHRHPLLSAVTKVLGSLEGLPDPSPRRVRWTPLLAGVTAVVMAFDAGCAATVRFGDALECLGAVLRGKARAPRTYNGLLKALCRQAKTILPVLKADLRRQALGVLERAERVGGWVLLAADGSKEDLPRTRSNTKAFGIGDNGRCPQAFITSIVGPATGLIWDWRVGRARASEKKHLLAMIKDLPGATLLLGDGNFIGWPIWSALCARGIDFLIRIGGNVDLLADLHEQGRPPDLGKDSQVVYLWPGHQRARGGAPPLRLRLIRIRLKAGSMYLLTNVHDARRLSVKRAGEVYRRRWGVEVFYRTLKRTLGLGKLKSRSGPRARAELNWALVALAVAGLLSIPAILARRGPAGRYSPAGAFRVLRKGLLDRAPARGKSPAAGLKRALALAVGDGYTRKSRKRSRHRTRTRNTPKHHRLKPPVLTRADPALRALALQRLKQAAA